MESKSIREALRKGFTKGIRLFPVTVIMRYIEGNMVQIVDNDALGRAGKVSNIIAVTLATTEDVKATETESQKQRVNQTGKGFDESKIPILSLDHPTNNLVSWYRLVKAKGMGVSLNPAIEVME